MAARKRPRIRRTNIIAGMVDGESMMDPHPFVQNIGGGCGLLGV
jgi:hypothetical protein